MHTVQQFGATNSGITMQQKHTPPETVAAMPLVWQIIELTLGMGIYRQLSNQLIDELIKTIICLIG